jgi:hypothetical protein
MGQEVRGMCWPEHRRGWKLSDAIERDCSQSVEAPMHCSAADSARSFRETERSSRTYERQGRNQRSKSLGI